MEANMRVLALVVLAAWLSGCAVIFQGPRGKACFPWYSHICKSVVDLDR